MGVRRPTHLGVCVADLERSLGFYREALGFEEVGRLSVASETAARLLGLDDVALEAIYLERDGWRIELLHFRRPPHEGAGGPRAMNSLGLTHLSFRVDDIDGVCEKIGAAGGRVLEETRAEEPRYQTRVVFALDPDGTRLELVEAPGDPTALPLGSEEHA